MLPVGLAHPQELILWPDLPRLPNTGSNRFREWDTFSIVPGSIHVGHCRLSLLCVKGWTCAVGWKLPRCSGDVRRRSEQASSERTVSHKRPCKLLIWTFLLAPCWATTSSRGLNVGHEWATRGSMACDCLVSTPTTCYAF